MPRLIDIKPKAGALIDIKPKLGNFGLVRGRVYERTLVAGQLILTVPLVLAPASVTYVVGND